MEKKFVLTEVYDETKAPAPKAAAVEPEKKNLSINIRQIKNGWVVSRSWDEEEKNEDGHCCTRWKNEEEFYPQNPITNG